MCGRCGRNLKPGEKCECPVSDPVSGGFFIAPQFMDILMNGKCNCGEPIAILNHDGSFCAECWNASQPVIVEAAHA